MIEALVRLTGAAIQVISRRTRTRRKPPRHYEYHDLGNANYVFKYTGKKNQPRYRCINCAEVLQRRVQRSTVGGSVQHGKRYRDVRYLVCVNDHPVPVAANFKV